jgi:hypothetical protein
MTIVLQWLPMTVLLIDLVIKIIALGTIPWNRRRHPRWPGCC